VALYDFAKNDYQGGSAIAAADKIKANAFLQLVWKSSTTAGFAKAAASQVGMYCPKATETKAQFATNVGAKCLTASKVNSCFNKVNRDAVNAKRKLHGAVPLSDDPGAGATLQLKLTTIAAATWKKGELDLPKETTALAKPTGCQDIFFKFDGADGASDATFMTTPVAVKEWYGYSKYYNFEKGTTIYPKDAKDKKQVDREADYFKGMLWRSYGRVSFAVRAPWVVGRLCPPTGATASTTRTAVDNVENVNPVCTLKSTEADGGYNRCYNKLALRYHNEQRAARQGTKNLALDARIAKYIQAEMEKPGFATAGKITNRGPWAGCGESTYKQDKTATPGAADLVYTNEAAKAWYAGHAEYDPATGKQVASGDAAKWAKL
jgi:uncharacterized protein YkwD